MFIRSQPSVSPMGVPRRGRPRRHGRGLSVLPPRLRRLVETAFALHGDLPSTMRALGLSVTACLHQISQLRALGLARTVHLYDPRRVGRDHECLTLVRMRVQTREAIAAFESWCVQDPTISLAVRVCGRFDYQLTTFHADVREATRWRRVLESRAEVAKVEQRQVRTLHGHQLPGLPLLGDESPQEP
jgi:DNA-binding Lrp family transcriptional regulator